MPLVITQNGEAKAVIQDVASYEETQETLALLKILALGNRQIEVRGDKTRLLKHGMMQGLLTIESGWYDGGLDIHRSVVIRF